VPKRAAHYPVLANAIFALASRHLNVLTGSDDSASPHYVSKCLQILINNLEDPLGHWDENFLAAVIILRSHEEMSGMWKTMCSNELSVLIRYTTRCGRKMPSTWHHETAQLYLVLRSRWWAP